jgi:hypothetical protein
MSRISDTMPHRQKPRLLAQVRDALRARHYSLRTEEAYVQWVKRFVLFHHKRHPQETVSSRALATMTT